MSSKYLFAPPPAPPSKLARYRTLSPLAGVRVSPLCFGGLGIGDKWQNFGLGSMDKENSFKLLDAYFDLGVSYPHTSFHATRAEPDFARAIFSTLPIISNVLFSFGSLGLIHSYFFLFYSQDGASEEFVGEWAEKRGIRDQLVIATKVRKIMPYFLRLSHIDNICSP
jgi:hypothetical protein